MKEARVTTMSQKQTGRNKKNWIKRGILYDEKSNVLQME